MVLRRSITVLLWRCQAGFTMDDLIQAERQLAPFDESISSSLKRCPLASKIVNTLAGSRPKPWRGPLPKPRSSPPQTLGDVRVTVQKSRKKSRSPPSHVPHSPGGSVRASTPDMADIPRKKTIAFQILNHQTIPTQGCPVPTELISRDNCASLEERVSARSESTTVSDAKQSNSVLDQNAGPTYLSNGIHALWYVQPLGLVDLFANAGTYRKQRSSQNLSRRQSYADAVRRGPPSAHQDPKMHQPAGRGRGTTHGGSQQPTSDASRFGGNNGRQDRDFVPHWQRGDRYGGAGRGDSQANQSAGRGHAPYAHQSSRGHADRPRGDRYGHGEAGCGQFATYPPAFSQGRDRPQEEFHPGYGGDRDRGQYRPRKNTSQHHNKQQHVLAPSSDAAQVKAAAEKVVKVDSMQVDDNGETSGKGYSTAVPEQSVGAGKKAKVQCAQCGRRGHVTVDCPIPLLCAICESKLRVTHKCHLLKAPKPIAQTVGFGAPGLGFHCIPVSDKEYNDTKEPSAWALISIRGGTLTIDQVKGELERLVPITWQWEIKEHGENEFLTVFPNALELARLQEFGEAKVKNHPGLFIECKIWGSHDEVKFQLPEVWVQVGGIPNQLRKHYLILWAVGTLIGATQMVDMVFTRSGDLARIRVAVLDPKKIPETLQVVFGKYLHDIYFIVEDGDGSSGQNVSNLNRDPMNEDDDDMLGDEEQELRKLKNTKDATVATNKINAPTQEHVNATNTQQGKQCASEPIDLERGAETVLADGLSSSPSQLLTPATGSCTALSDDFVADKMASEAMLQQGAEVISDEVVNTQLEKIVDHVIAEDVEQDNLVPSKTALQLTPVRRSKRREFTVDEDSLERAERLVAIKNLEIPTTGNLQSNLLDTVMERSSKKKRPLLKWACRFPETLAMEIFAKHGWPSYRRISFSQVYPV
ncbi:hypothetical protein BS78_04G324700 [Paspalum vaginatum]|nr:hypothetical protein BS78_04G324700 [Paspalum vaginatum]